MGYGYCLRVIEVYPPDDDDRREGLKLERWGQAGGQPIKDGHQNHSWMRGLRRVLPGVWKDQWEFDTPRWGCCPLYYRLMTTGPRGQMELI
jgi:hypothetical protein